MYMPVKAKRIFVIVSLIATALVFLLECLPNSLVTAKWCFDEANKPAYHIITTSYWDPRPMTYGVVTPFITFLLTIACIVILSIRIKKPNSLRAVSMGLTTFTFIASFIYFAFANCEEAVTISAVFITALMFAVAVYNGVISSYFRYETKVGYYSPRNNTYYGNRKRDDLPNVKIIYFAGGCFWGVERYFSQVRGVVQTTVGYANGTKKYPSYEDLKKGLDDAAETVQILYDENQVSLEKLIELYLRIVDPFSKNKQGEDEGVQYRTGIYFTKMGDEEIVKTYFDELNLKDHKIELLYLKQFYPAEEYHQQYLEKHPDGYCHVNMAVLHEDEKKTKEENKESVGRD